MKRFLLAFFLVVACAVSPAIAKEDTGNVASEWKTGAMKGYPVEGWLHVEIRNPARFIKPFLVEGYEKLLEKMQPFFKMIVAQSMALNPESIVIMVGGQSEFFSKTVKDLPPDFVTIYVHRPRQGLEDIPEEAFPINYLNVKNGLNLWITKKPSLQYKTDSDIAAHYRRSKQEDVFLGVGLLGDQMKGVMVSSLPGPDFIEMGPSLIHWENEDPVFLYEFVNTSKNIQKNDLSKYILSAMKSIGMQAGDGVGHLFIDSKGHQSIQFQSEKPFPDHVQKNIAMIPADERLPDYHFLVAKNVDKKVFEEDFISSVLSKNSAILSNIEPNEPFNLKELEQKPALLYLTVSLPEFWPLLPKFIHFRNWAEKMSPFLMPLFDDANLRNQPFPAKKIVAVQKPGEKIIYFQIPLYNDSENDISEFWRQYIRALNSHPSLAAKTNP